MPPVAGADVSMRRVISLLLLLLLSAMGALSLGVSPALAHNTFRSSSPADGEILTTSPVTWTLKFDKSVPLDSASGSVVNGDGTRTVLGAPRHAEADTIIVFDLPAGLSGVVTTRWALVSTDGHVISGRVVFTVNAAAVSTTLANDGTQPGAVVAPTTTTSSPLATTGAVDTATDDGDGAVPEPVRVSLRIVNYLAIVLLGGILFVNFDVAAGAISTSRGRRLARWGALGLAVIPLVQFFVLVGDVGAGGSPFTTALFDTISLTPGAMTLMRGVIGGVIVKLIDAPLRRGRFSADEPRLLVGLCAMYLVALAYVGHSRSQSWPLVGIPVDVLHTAAIAVWLGGLVAMIAVVTPLVDEHDAVAAFRRFGLSAQRAVAVIAVTGLIQTGRLHSGGFSLVTSSHGLLILAKVVVVGAMLLLAARNRRLLLDERSLTPQFAGRTRQLVVSATVNEVLCGLLVLGLTAVLVAVTPG